MSEGNSNVHLFEYHHKCALCGRKFTSQTPEWGYTIGQREYCRYNHMMEDDRKLRSSRNKKKRDDFDSDDYVGHRGVKVNMDLFPDTPLNNAVKSWINEDSNRTINTLITVAGLKKGSIYQTLKLGWCPEEDYLRKISSAIGQDYHTWIDWNTFHPMNVLEEYQSAIVDNLRIIYREREMTETNLCSWLKRDHPYVIDLLAGNRKITMRNAKRIADLVCQSFEWIIQPHEESEVIRECEVSEADYKRLSPL